MENFQGEMIYATELVQRYRQVLQYLWNHHFWGPEQFRDTELIYEFERLKRPLFAALVLDRLGPGFQQPDGIFGETFKLSPRMKGSKLVASFLVERPRNAFVSLVGPFDRFQFSLSVIDFYDWVQGDFRDFTYFMARIDAFLPDPSLVGSRALVEVNQVDVIWYVSRISVPAESNRITFGSSGQECK